MGDYENSDKDSDNEDNFDCILGEKFSVENYKFSKVIKNYFFDFLKFSY